jgi:hypothetical protein
MPMRAYPALLAVAATVTAACLSKVEGLAGLHVTPEAFQPLAPTLGRCNATNSIVMNEVLVARESFSHKPLGDLDLYGNAGALCDCLKSVDVARIFSIRIGHGNLQCRQKILACR